MPPRMSVARLGWRLRYYVRPVAELREGMHAPVGQPPDQPTEHVRGRTRVGQRPVTRRRPGSEEPGERSQLDVGHLVRVHDVPGEHDSIQYGEAGPGQSAGLAGGREEAEVEGRVVRDKHAPVGES